MLYTQAIVCLIIYSAVLVGSYIVVRRRWMGTYPIFIVGFTVNAVTLFFFSLFRGTSILHALVVCVIWSGCFTAASVMMATLFRDNPIRNTSRAEVSFKRIGVSG